MKEFLRNYLNAIQINEGGPPVFKTQQKKNVTITLLFFLRVGYSKNNIILNK